MYEEAKFMYKEVLIITVCMYVYMNSYIYSTVHTYVRVDVRLMYVFVVYATRVR